MKNTILYLKVSSLILGFILSSKAQDCPPVVIYEDNIEVKKGSELSNDGWFYYVEKKITIFDEQGLKITTQKKFFWMERIEKFTMLGSHQMENGFSYLLVTKSLQPLLSITLLLRVILKWIGKRPM